MNSASLLPLVESRHVIVCAGAGGVGKTTVAAALALGAAMRGRRVLCLTIDPAKRLADTLGISGLGPEPSVVAQERFVELGLDVPGSLSVLVIDTKSTFDEIVTRNAKSPEARDRILDNRLYNYVSTSLAGTQSYMAMEKVLAVKSDPRFDLIVLDTPPTSDALDFLNAPERLIEALDSPAMRWLVEAFSTQGRFSLNVLARGVAALLRSVGKLTGQGFLESMAEFVSELNDLFGGFKERARLVSRAFREKEFAYTIVASPAAPALAEARFFVARLGELGMRGDAIVVNRVNRASGERPALDDVMRALAERGAPPELAASALRAFDEERRQGELDAQSIERFERELSRITRHTPPTLRVPVLAGEVHDLATLRVIAERLLG
jgi:anion-transporting  ArsA/GET3 family ATPase